MVINKFIKDNKINIIFLKNLLTKIFILPLLQFILPVVNNSSNTINEVKRIQNKIYKIIFKLNNRFPTDLMNGIFMLEPAESKIKRQINKVKDRIDCIEGDSLIKQLLYKEKGVKTLEKYNLNLEREEVKSKDIIIRELQKELFGIKLYDRTIWCERWNEYLSYLIKRINDTINDRQSVLF